MTKSPRPPLPSLPRSFTAIDFETANEFERASACAVAVVEVEDNRVVAQKSWLINPQTRFSSICVAIHGITPKQVAQAGTFAEVWDDGLGAMITADTYLVAHNMGFDNSVLLGSFARYRLSPPRYRRNCSYQLTKKIFPGWSSYSLPDVARHFALPNFRHHDAEADAVACAGIMIKLNQQYITCPILHKKTQAKPLSPAEMAKYGLTWV